MTTLKGLYIEELQDLWSANDQIAEVLAEMADKASDHTLADRLSRAKSAVDQHTKSLKNLLEDISGYVGKERCKGMERLVKEARKHATESDLEGAALDVAMISQFHRMCHYGIAGFGTLKAFAKAWQNTQAAERLDTAPDHIYDSQALMTELADRSRNLAALGCRLAVLKSHPLPFI